jgi:hypothetical protein
MKTTSRAPTAGTRHYQLVIVKKVSRASKGGTGVFGSRLDAGRFGWLYIRVIPSHAIELAAA